MPVFVTSLIKNIDCYGTTFRSRWADEPMTARSFHAYCIGTPKSGTHSIAEVFGTRYRVAHEPEYDLLIETILSASSGAIDHSRLAKFVRARDKQLNLELECSHPLFYLLD